MSLLGLISAAAQAQATNAVAPADPVATQAQIDQYFPRTLADAAIQQVMLDAAKLSANLLARPCPDATFKTGSSIALLGPLKFDEQGKWTYGAFRRSVDEAGCGESRRLNVIAIAKPGEIVRASPLLPGTTRADLLLQRDSFVTVLAVAGASAHEPNATCKVQYVSDTQFLGEVGDVIEGTKGKSWQELWTVDACTKESVVPMLFVPSKTGTAFQAGPSNMVKVSPLN